MEATAALAAHLFGGKLNFLGSYFFTGNYLMIMAMKAGCLSTQWEGQIPFLRQRSKRCTPEMTKSGGQVASHPASFFTCVVVYHSQRSICAFLSVYICAYTHRQTRPYTYFLPTSLHIRATGDDSEPLHPGPEELLFLQRVFGLNSHIKIMIIINKFLPCSSSCKPPKSSGMFCHKSFISVSLSQKRRKQYLDWKPQ